MRTKLVIAVVILAVATGVFFVAANVRSKMPGRGAPDSPAVGVSAPDFSVADSKGKIQSVSQYKGKYVVLEWFNPGCPFVKKHYGSGSMQKLQEEFTGQGVVWLTVDSSAPGKQGYLTCRRGQRHNG